MTHPTIVGRYDIGEIDADVAYIGGIYYPLTDCCGAVATGSMGVTACRDCYAEVDTWLGACWTEAEWKARAFTQIA